MTTNEGMQTSKWSDQACRQEVAEMHTRVGGTEESTRTETEAAGSSGDTPRAGGAEEPTRTAAEDADTRRGLKISAELPPDDGAMCLLRGRGEHLDDDVPTVTPIVQPS